MKNRLIKFLLLSAFLLLCCGCQDKGAIHPASSRAPRFDETHRLSGDWAVVLADVVVQEVYPNICKGEGTGDYFLTSCKIREPFFVSTSCSNYEVLSKENADFLLWVNVDHIQERYYTELQEIISQAESLIVYAEEKPAIVGYNGLADEMFQTLKEYGLNCSATDSYLTALPSLHVTDPYSWTLIPIMDGVVDGAELQTIVNDSHSAEMIYDIEHKDDSRISSGDTAEDVYKFLKEYVEKSNK